MICGVDEAGRGPVIGPLVVAGIKLKDEHKLAEIKVKDSKKLTPKRREILSVRIKQLTDDYEILVIPAKDIDDMRKVMTLNEIEVNAFTQVVKKLRPDICYVDSADVDEAARHVLIALHTVAASVFAVSIGYHFYHNWKSIFKYFKKQEDRFEYVRELAVVTGTMVMLLTLTGIYIYIKYIP